MPGKIEYPVDKLFKDVVSTSSLCKMFAEEFGEEDADRVIQCGSHRRERVRADDYFLDCIVVAIAYKCFTEWHEKHGFVASGHDMLKWIGSHVTREDLLPYSADGEMVKSNKKLFNSVFGK